MEALYRRTIASGKPYDGLFEEASGIITTIKKNAGLEDTISFLPKAVKQTLYQTKEIARQFEGLSVMETCRNIWHFVYKHIQYKKDEAGFEQIRSPRRSWQDRRSGVDCDCYTVFISSILTNLSIPHVLRITKYSKNHFQHIYPIVPFNGSYITMDCVTNKFNYEVPFSDKKDYPMELQFLDGLDGESLGLFGKKQKKKAMAANAASTPGIADTLPAATPKKKKGFFKKVLNVVNKVNPGTVVLRNGVLAAMKLNIMNVAKRLRWSYLSPDKIGQHGIEPAKFQKLVAARQKLENIFYGAGGNPNNMRKAILSGKGNKDKAVSGLGMLPMEQWSGYMNEHTPLEQLLGDEIYSSENVEGMEGFGGFGELGEPITLATVGAAMGVIAGIAAALKQIGSIFKKGSPASADFDEAATTAPENNVNATAAAAAASEAMTKANITAFPTTNAASLPDGGDETSYNTTVPSHSALTQNNNAESKDDLLDTSSIDKKVANTNDDTTSDKKEGFWNKNKKWVKPVIIGAGGLVLIAIGVKLMKGNKASNKSTTRTSSLSGVPRRRKKKKKYHHKHSQKKSVALL